jgi:S1-C subfamily serine protease
MIILRIASVVATAMNLMVASGAFAQHDWTKQIKAFKEAVVNIETAKEIVFETEEPGVGYATGFVVDAQRGIIATNAHVTGISPSTVKVNFYNGNFTEAKALYYDPVHDFGFYKIDPASLGFELRAVRLGSWSQLEVGDEVLLIGNNEKEEYSIKFGAVANLNVNKGDRYTSYIHTTFDRAGGSSGSPVWDTGGRVVGIHAAGNDTSSFELRVDYMRDALAAIQAGVPMKRGGIGADLELISTGEAFRHYGLPEMLAGELKSGSEGVPKVIQVQSVTVHSPAEGVLHPGDILYRMNGRVLRDDLYWLDATLNASVGQRVAIDLYHNGTLKTVKVTVADLEEGKIRRFVRFAGGIFHDITPKMRWYHDYEGRGVFMPYADEGSSFSKVGLRDIDSGNYSVVITEVAGQPILGLDDFVRVCAGMTNTTHSFILRQDLALYHKAVSPKSITLNLQYGPLEVFEWNPESLEWEKRNLL